jgi:hypothetical protein
MTVCPGTQPFCSRSRSMSLDSTGWVQPAGRAGNHPPTQVNLKIVCKENFKYEVQEMTPANQVRAAYAVLLKLFRCASISSSHHVRQDQYVAGSSEIRQVQTDSESGRICLDQTGSDKQDQAGSGRQAARRSG